MLKSVHQELLYSEEEEFEIDFQNILNEKVVNTDLITLEDKFMCDQCKFKASSQRALRAHKSFVHESIFYLCKRCGARTKTTGGMEHHLSRKHNSPNIQGKEMGFRL